MPQLGDLSVFVLDEDDNHVWFHPGDDVPPWAAEQMGDHCFVAETDEVPEVVPAVVEPPAAPVVEEPAAAENEAPQEPSGGDGEQLSPPAEPTTTPAGGDLQPPAQAGPAATRDVWADYATANGVAIGDDWRRSQIVEACKNAGVRVE